MNRFIKATYHSKQKAAEFVTDDGRHLIRTGGSLQWRICNGGDLSSPVTNGVPTPKKTKDYIGFANPSDSDHQFFIFPDYETGRAQLRISLRRKHNNKTLGQMVEAYAPRHENKTDKYASDLSSLSGVAKTAIIKDLDDTQLGAVMDGIERLEGYYSDEETRKESWATVSHVNATDGTGPIAGEEIVVRKDDKEVVLKSNAVGRFPPIVHGSGTTEILHKNSDGTLKKVADLPPDEGKHFSLLSQVAEFFGTSALVKPPTNPVLKKHPLTYEVKPKDYLGKIAQMFGTTVDEIKHDNRMVKEAIFPGQVLGIYGPPPRKLPVTPPKKAIPSKQKKPENALGSGAIKASNISPSTKLPSVLAAANMPETQTKPARSQDGQGEALALIPPDKGLVPWVKYALEEAKQFKGAEESEIQKKINFHSEIKDGRTSLVGDSNAWCAAFVNWCLMKANYPIVNPKTSDFIDRVADTGRAEGFRHAKTKDTIVDNPLYFKIEEPVFGAIAIATNHSGHGHHAGLVYGRSGKNSICLLGGNQGNRIKFSPFDEKEKKVTRTKKNKKGEFLEVVSFSDHLEFFLPELYRQKYTESPKALENVDFKKLNESIGYFEVKDEKNESTS